MDNLNKRIEGLSPAKRALLELRLRNSSAGDARPALIAPRANRDSAVVSFAQERLWYVWPLWFIWFL
jgi:hypothetical protein